MWSNSSVFGMNNRVMLRLLGLCRSSANKPCPGRLHCDERRGVKSQAIAGREGLLCCEMTRLPHFLANLLTDDSKVVSHTRWPPFSPQEDSWYSFLLEAESIPGP
jgi:hypothetical protein